MNEASALYGLKNLEDHLHSRDVYHIRLLMLYSRTLHHYHSIYYQVAFFPCVEKEPVCKESV